MMEALKELLSTVAIACVPVVAGFLASHLKNKTDTLVARTQNDMLKSALQELDHAISASVAMVSQTYVKKAKESGSWDKPAQMKALAKAGNNALETLGASSRVALERMHPDLKRLVETLIEEQVYLQSEKQEKEREDK